MENLSKANNELVELRGLVLGKFIIIESALEDIIYKFLTGEHHAVSFNNPKYSFFYYHLLIQPKFEASMKINSVKTIYQILDNKKYIDITTKNKSRNIFMLLSRLQEIRNIFAHKIISEEGDNYVVVAPTGKFRGKNDQSFPPEWGEGISFRGHLSFSPFPKTERENILKQLDFVKEYFLLFLIAHKKLNEGIDSIDAIITEEDERLVKEETEENLKRMDEILKESCVNDNVGAYLLARDN